MASLLEGRIVPLPLADGRGRQSPVVQRIMDENLRRCSFESRQHRRVWEAHAASELAITGAQGNVHCVDATGYRRGSLLAETCIVNA